MASGRTISTLTRKNSKKNRKSSPLGQNFLTNQYIAERIAASVPDEALHHLFEIGPGKGILTKELLKLGGKIRAVEIDETLRPYLCPIVKEHGQDLDIIWGDALDILGTIFMETTFLISNLPFNISTELFYRIYDGIPYSDIPKTPFLGGIVMVQEEFGRRLISGPGGKDYGRLSILFQSKMEAQPILRVKRGKFDPVPDVDALVIGFEPKRTELRIPMDEPLFQKILIASFSSRRKKLRNSLHPGNLGMSCGINDIRELLKEMEVDDLRPEQLSIDRFMDIADSLMRH